MTTPILITGWDHGLATLVAGGTGLCDVVESAGISVQGTVKRTGGYSLKHDSTIAKGDIFYYIASPTVLVGSIYVRAGALPITNSNDNGVLMAKTSGGSYIAFNIALSSSVYTFAFGLYGGTYQFSSTHPVINQWYRVDFKIDVSANPWTMDWSIDGAAQTQVTNAAAADTIYKFFLGDSIGSDTTQVLYYDDLVLSFTGADYPIGVHGVIGLRPNADGTHNNAASTLEDASANLIDGSNYFAFSNLNANPWVSSLGNYIQQATINATKYLEINFEDTTQNNILGVSALLQYQSASSGTDKGSTIILDSNNQESDIFGSPSTPANMNTAGAGAYYKRVIITPPSGGWTMAHVNALRARLGYSSDVTPVPYWNNVILEVLYGPATVASLATRKTLMGVGI